MREEYERAEGEAKPSLKRAKGKGQTALEFILILSVILGILAIIAFVGSSLQKTGVLGVRQAKTNFECGLSKMYLGSYSNAYDGTKETAPRFIGVHEIPLRLAWTDTNLPPEGFKDECKLNGFDMKLYFYHGNWRVYLANASGGWFVYAGVGDDKTEKIYANLLTGTYVLYNDPECDALDDKSRADLSPGQYALASFDLPYDGNYSFCLYVISGKFSYVISSASNDNLMSGTLYAWKNYSCTPYTYLEKGIVSVNLTLPPGLQYSKACWNSPAFCLNPPYMELKG